MAAISACCGGEKMCGRNKNEGNCARRVAVAAALTRIGCKNLTFTQRASHAKMYSGRLRKCSKLSSCMDAFISTFLLSSVSLLRTQIILRKKSAKFAFSI